MPYYLARRRGTATTQVTPCWLHEEDAQAAIGDMETLEVAGGWWASRAVFPRKIGFNVKRPRELMAERYWQGELEREMDRYYELCRSGAHSSR